MKIRTVKKKWNKEIRSIKKDLKDPKWSIEKEFTSHEYYDDVMSFTWSDIFFIGTYEGRQRVFNCTIVSSLDEFEEKVDSKVNEEFDKIYPDSHENCTIDFVESTRPNLKEMKISYKDEDLEQQMKLKKGEILKTILESNSIKVRSYVQTLEGFAFGVGLNIVTEEKYLTKQIVLDYVRKIKTLNIVGTDKIYLTDNEISYEKSDYNGYLNSKLLVV